MPFVDKNITKKQKESIETHRFFIGRENELTFFTENILRSEKPAYNIISIYGQAGVGKSTLLARFADEAAQGAFRDYCKVAMVDERQTTPANVMEKLAQQLGITGKFEKELTNYKEALQRSRSEHELENDAFWRKMNSFVSSSIKEAPLPIANNLLGKGAELLGEYALDKVHDHRLLQDAKRLEDPTKNLTSAFVMEMNTLAGSLIMDAIEHAKRERRILLLIDTFEQLATELSPWLLNYFLEAEISDSIVLIIAGRQPIEHSTPQGPKRWLPYLEHVIYNVQLESFTKAEVQQYMRERGIVDSTQVTQIWKLSQGLPLYLGLLTSHKEAIVDPASGVIANFLRWIPEQEVDKRQLVLDAALLSYPFNQDVLTAFSYIAEQDRPTLYRWLTKQPFVLPSLLDGRYSYHHLARELFSRYLFQNSPNEYRHARKAIIIYYQQILQAMEADQNAHDFAQWVEIKLALGLQFFMLGDEMSRSQALEHIVDVVPFPDFKRETISSLQTLREEPSTFFISSDTQSIINNILLYLEATQINQRVIDAISSLLRVAAQSSTPSKPLQAKLYVMRAQAHKDLPDINKALYDYEQAIHLDPTDDTPYALRSAIYYDLEKWKKALADCTQAIKLAPDAANHYNHRAMVYSKQGKWRQALADCERAIELSPSDGFFYLDRAIIYREMRKWQHALADCNKALEYLPQEEVCYIQRAQVYYEQRAWEEAYDDYTKVIELSQHGEQRAHFYSKRSFVNANSGKLEQALADCNQAIDLVPNYAFYYDLRASIYSINGNLQKAIEDYTKEIKLLPEEPIPYRQRAELYTKQGNWANALADYTQALRFFPDADIYYIFRADVYIKLGDWTSALADCNQAIKLTPDTAHYYTHRAEIYCHTEMWDEAVDDYNQAIELSPDIAIYYLYRGEIYSKQQEWQKALADYTQAVELDPNETFSYLCRASIHMALRNWQSAIEDLDRVIVLSPDNAYPYASRASLCIRLNRWEQASLDLAKAAELSSTDEEMRTEIDMLFKKLLNKTEGCDTNPAP